MLRLTQLRFTVRPDCASHHLLPLFMILFLWKAKYKLNQLFEIRQMAEVCLDVVAVKTYRSMGGTALCVCMGVLEKQRKRGVRGFERDRKRKRGKAKRGIDFLGLSRACN